MPYIKQYDRAKFKNFLDSFDALIITQCKGTLSPGEMNFLFTSMILTYLKYSGINYIQINQMMGILENVKQEFYRRVAVPYEENKIKESGDVY